MYYFRPKKLKRKVSAIKPLVDCGLLSATRFKKGMFFKFPGYSTLYKVNRIVDLGDANKLFYESKKGIVYNVVVDWKDTLILYGR